MHNNAGEQISNRWKTDTKALEKLDKPQRAVDRIRSDTPPNACGRSMVPETFSKEIAGTVEEAREDNRHEAHCIESGAAALGHSKNVSEDTSSDNYFGSDVSSATRDDVDQCSSASDRLQDSYCPIVPLGHQNGIYYFISASGELRCMKAEALEAGRGVQALFCGVDDLAEDWCKQKFATNNGVWNSKEVGRWIIRACNQAGVFDPNNADIKSIGVWREYNGTLVAHCGDRLAYNDGQEITLPHRTDKSIMIGTTAITPPADHPASSNELHDLLEQLRMSWGWKTPYAADVVFGWVSAAFLGGYPEWRSHLYVHGSRGSGKSKLMQFAALLLGELAGGVINDATEAGLRQSRNNQARPVLIDEFEPDDTIQNGSRHDAMMALFRRMSGGEGGRISRGSAHHSSVSFRIVGAAFVTSINHIHLEPQDRSRFVMLELGSLPCAVEPARSAAALRELERHARDIASAFFCRMVLQSSRWDETHSRIAAEARRLGGDARQADTVATILTGRDLALFDDAIDTYRLKDLEPILREMLNDAAEADAACEGTEALDYLLGTNLSLDHGIKRSVRELLQSTIGKSTLPGVEDPKGALARNGIHYSEKKLCIGVTIGRNSQAAKIFRDTKWRNGAHVSALLKVDGANKPKNPVRFGPCQQHRVLLIPISSWQIKREEAA